MRKNTRRVIRVIAVVLAALLAGGVVFGALMGALAEPANRDQCEISAKYLADEQALQITQRLIYTNRTQDRLDGVVFYAAGNMLRRESALMYEAGDLERVFYAGYAPGGIDLRSVRFDGAAAEYGFQGENELYLRVACDLAPGQSGVFEFDYYLLLVNCGAFQGAGETDVRLSAFYFIPGVYDPNYGEFIVKQPLAHTRWLYSGAADYAVTLELPEGYIPSGTGGGEILETENGRSTWRFEAEDAREFAMSFGKRWREATRATGSGVALRALANVRGAGDRALDAAARAIEQCEAWFGPFPLDQLTIAQSDYPLGAMNFPGMIWVSSELLEARNSGALEHRLRFCVAQQYFGLSAYVEPSADAWLSDSVCEYIAYLLLEAEDGREAFLAAINRDWVDALQLTIPGGLSVTSDARLFDRYEYDIVVLTRGAVVLHELRRAMGLDALLAGLSNFYRMGGSGDTLTEMDFVAAMDDADGGSWEAFLTDWVFNVGEYVNQTIDWLD